MCAQRLMRTALTSREIYVQEFECCQDHECFMFDRYSVLSYLEILNRAVENFVKSMSTV